MLCLCDYEGCPTYHMLAIAMKTFLEGQFVMIFSSLVDQISVSATYVHLPAKANFNRYMMCEGSEMIQLGEICPNTCNKHSKLADSWSLSRK